MRCGFGVSVAAITGVSRRRGARARRRTASGIAGGYHSASPGRCGERWAGKAAARLKPAAGAAGNLADGVGRLLPCSGLDSRHSFRTRRCRVVLPCRRRSVAPVIVGFLGFRPLLRFRPLCRWPGTFVARGRGWRRRRSSIHAPRRSGFVTRLCTPRRRILVSLGIHGCGTRARRGDRHASACIIPS
jgi:hypothetical protein